MFLSGCSALVMNNFDDFGRGPDVTEAAVDGAEHGVVRLIGDSRRCPRPNVRPRPISQYG